MTTMKASAARGSEAPNTDYIKNQGDQYARTSNACIAKLGAVWKDMEISFEQQKLELLDITKRAQDVWNAAVGEAEARWAALQEKIDAASAEISNIREELGEDFHPSQEEPDARGAARTTKSRWEAVREKLDFWTERRAERLQSYQELQAQLLNTKLQMGFEHVTAPQHNITQANLEYLKLELHKLQEEKDVRAAELDALVSQLRQLGSDLGENERQAEAGVHPTLIYIWEHQKQATQAGATKSSAGRAKPAAAAAERDISLQTDLSDATLRQLRDKIGDMLSLKAQREQHAHEQMLVLHSLWDALGCPRDSPDRLMFTRLMAGPYRLHAKSLEKCMSEVSRLEGCKTAVMQELIASKAEQLRAMCAETHLKVPDVAALVGTPDANKKGQIADMLSKLVLMISEVQAVVNQRTDTLRLIGELEATSGEVEWLHDYDNDAQRFKGRDANRKLQRAIKARKLLASVPSSLQQLQSALQEWERAQGEPFMYDGKDYLRDEFERMSDKLQFLTVDKARPPKARGPNPAVNCTPIPKSKGTTPNLTPRALSARHSFSQSEWARQMIVGQDQESPARLSLDQRAELKRSNTTATADKRKKPTPSPATAATPDARHAAATAVVAQLKSAMATATPPSRTPTKTTPDSIAKRLDRIWNVEAQRAVPQLAAGAPTSSEEMAAVERNMKAWQTGLDTMQQEPSIIDAEDSQPLSIEEIDTAFPSSTTDAHVPRSAGKASATAVAATAGDDASQADQRTPPAPTANRQDSVRASGQKQSVDASISKAAAAQQRRQNPRPKRAVAAGRV